MIADFKNVGYHSNQGIRRYDPAARLACNINSQPGMARMELRFRLGIIERQRQSITSGDAMLVHHDEKKHKTSLWDGTERMLIQRLKYQSAHPAGG